MVRTTIRLTDPDLLTTVTTPTYPINPSPSAPAKANEVELQYIDTKEQKADIFMNPLTTSEFQRTRYLTCGW